MKNINNFYKIKKIKKQSCYKKLKSNFKKFNGNFLKFVSFVTVIISFVILFFGIGELILNSTENVALTTLANIFVQIGKISFENLPIIFCLIVVSVSTNETKAIIASFVGFLVFIGVQKSFIRYDTSEEGIKYVKDILFFYKNTNFLLGNNLGIPSLNMSVLSGIIVGVICSYIYKKINNIQFSRNLYLIRGFPLVCLVLMLTMVLLSIFFILIWIGINSLLVKVYDWMAISNWNNFSGQSFVYSLLNVILTPIGFKQNFMNVFSEYSYINFLTRQEFQDFFKKIAQNYGWIQNDFSQKWNNEIINNIWETLSTSNLSAKKLLILDWINFINVDSLPTLNYGNLSLYDWFGNCGMFYSMILKLPPTYAINLGASIGIGLAIILTCKKENRTPICILMIFILLTIFITGNTTALDLLVLFTSPALFFIVYLPLSALNGLFMSLLHVRIMQSPTSQGFISLIQYGIIPSSKGTNYEWIFLFITIWFILFTTIFYKYIKIRNLPFIGRTETILKSITWKQCHDLWNH